MKIKSKEDVEKIMEGYQRAKLSKNNIIMPYGSTESKYKAAEKGISYLENKEKFSFMDFGCCFGAIGLKIKQEFKDSNCNMSGVNKEELEIVKNISSFLNIDGVNIIKKNVISIEASYDLTLYFSLVHHVIYRYGFENLAKLISKQTNNVAVVEFPMHDDVLCQKVLKEKSSLMNDENIVKVFSKFFDILDKIEIFYPHKGEKNTQLNRICYIIKKKVTK